MTCRLFPFPSKDGTPHSWQWQQSPNHWASRDVPLPPSFIENVSHRFSVYLSSWSVCFHCCCLVAKLCQIHLPLHGLHGPPGSFVHGISQARILEWLPFSPPGDHPNRRIKLASPALAGGFFTTVPPGKPWLFSLGDSKLYCCHLLKNTTGRTFNTGTLTPPRHALPRLNQRRKAM